MLQGLNLGLMVEEVDITNDPTLFRRYFEKIPVLSIDGHITLAAPIRMDDVLAALQSDT